MNVIHVFDCPYHGKQRGVFCFRAFQHENRKRWKKIQVDNEETPLSDEELNVLLKSMGGGYT